VRERLHLANDPAQLPLVSVLVRSMDRACLPEALASVALQTYPNVELVVVNASGGPHRPLDFLPPTLPWRLVSPAPTAHTTDSPCGRAQAANLALAAAQGEYALFLDDDDLLQPPHLERLVAALQGQAQAAGAYAGVRVETHDGVHLRDYDLPWSRQRLLGVNYLPIHAVLFRTQRVRQQGLRFDEALPVLEDWHFWRQLTQDADLVHCPGVSAVYRQGLGQSALGDAQHPHHWRLWHTRLLVQWVQGAPAALLADTLAWHAVELDRSQADAGARISRLEKAAADAARHLQEMLSALDQARALVQDGEAARQALQQQLEAFSRESLAALQAKETALQLQASESARLLAEREAQAQRFAAEAQRELDALQQQLHTLAAEQAQALQQKETALQLQAAESARLLAEREAQAQRFAAEAQRELDALQHQLHTLAAEQAQALQAKEDELQRFAQHTGQVLDAKEAELQRVALQAQQALQARDAEHAAQLQRLQQDIAQQHEQHSRLQSELALREAELGAIQASRFWRWTAPLRRAPASAAPPPPPEPGRS
jgi:hypothetical protein